VELRELLARRRMVRSFDATPVDLDWLEQCCADALWAPSAGNSAGVRLSTIGRSLVPEFMAHATDEEWRRSARRASGLARAGAVVLVTTRPVDYTSRYAEPDKAHAGLDNVEAWPIPYWHTDAAMATMALLLLLEEAGLAATLWGNFRQSEEILRWARISEEELFASVLLGHADGRDVPSSSLTRDVPSRVERVRRIG